MDDLNSFIQNTPHPQELKRALAVQMTQQGYTYREIQNVLQVSLEFVTSCNQRYETGGVTGLKLNYCGTHGYLLAQQKQELFGWLKQRDFWQLEEVIDHIEQTYDLVFKSKQSYYDLLKEAGLRRNFSGRLNLPESSAWKKSQTTHPDKEDRQVQQKKRTLWSY